MTLVEALYQLWNDYQELADEWQAVPFPSDNSRELVTYFESKRDRAWRSIIRRPARPKEIKHAKL